MSRGRKGRNVCEGKKTEGKKSECELKEQVCTSQREIFCDFFCWEERKESIRNTNWQIMGRWITMNRKLWQYRWEVINRSNAVKWQGTWGGMEVHTCGWVWKDQLQKDLGHYQSPTCGLQPHLDSLDLCSTPREGTEKDSHVGTPINSGHGGGDAVHLHLKYTIVWDTN